MIVYRHLYTFEYPKYATYLKSLDAETLHSYFGYTATPEAIDMLVSKIYKESHRHEFIVASNNGAWVGVTHIAYGSKEVELGISVRPDFRRNGIGDELITRAILWCRNRQLLSVYMHCATRNTSVMNLVKKHNLKIDRDYDEADARITMPFPTFNSLAEEQVTTNLDWMQSTFSFSQ
jgi:GNAT superfamily N-acetyltransferase